ncbi:DMT family transporter [Alterisphingorhabdus coralli]|uniref:DMT family transporter n=1 Tax=Alterisphingorhabdus coralli TaxID=3071408 RepID=A0AA97F4I8_9SPHN|nr:DMT family transporter [Parasphingorhabdus sp. SCSIO 66989]WOE74189.1 DMT family transporter [Parasphingorhabdus sp. SCSIO 66989]
MAFTAPTLQQNRPAQGLAMRLLAVFALATMMALVKMAADRGVNTLESVFYRQAIAILFLIPIILSQGGFATVKTQRLGTHMQRLLVGLTGMMFNFAAVSLLPLAEATSITFTVPIFATLLAILLLSESVGWHRWSAILAGFAGVLIIVQPGGGAIAWQGALVALIGALLTALVSIIIRSLGSTDKPVTVVFWFTLLSLPPLSIGMFYYGALHDAETFLIIAGIGLCGGVGQLALTSSLRLAPVSIVLSADYTSLIWATFFGWLIWQSWPSVWTWIGAPLIIGSGLYIAWREHNLARRPQYRHEAKEQAEAN